MPLPLVSLSVYVKLDFLVCFQGMRRSRLRVVLLQPQLVYLILQVQPPMKQDLYRIAMYNEASQAIPSVQNSLELVWFSSVVEKDVFLLE